MDPGAPQAEWQDLLGVHQGLSDRAHPISPSRSMADGGAAQTGWAALWGTGDRLYCDIAGAGADGPRR